MNPVPKQTSISIFLNHRSSRLPCYFNNSQLLSVIMNFYVTSSVSDSKCFTGNGKVKVNSITENLKKFEREWKFLIKYKIDN